MKIMMYLNFLKSKNNGGMGFPIPPFLDVKTSKRDVFDYTQ